MATYKKYTSKSGEPTYYLRAFDDYDINGKQIGHSTTWKPEPGMTEKQIEKELKRQLVLFDEKVKKGLVLDGNITFAAYAKHYLETSELAPKTLECYTIMFEERIFKALGHIRLDKFQKHHGQAFVKQLQEDSKLVGSRAVLKPGIAEKMLKKFKSRDAAAKQIGLSGSTVTVLCRYQKVTMQTAEKVAAAMKQDIKKLFAITKNDAPLCKFHNPEILYPCQRSVKSGSYRRNNTF